MPDASVLAAIVLALRASGVLATGGIAVVACENRNMGVADGLETHVQVY